MTEIDSQSLHVCCTAQKLSKIKDFLAFAFAKKQSKSKKVKEQRWLGMSLKKNLTGVELIDKHRRKALFTLANS